MHQCIICGNTNYKEKKQFSAQLGIDLNLFKIIQCRKCRLISLYPVPTNDDLLWIYKNYAKSGDRENVEKQRMQNIYLKKINKIESYIPKGAELLDIGAGIGGFCKIAQDSGYKITGIEYEQQQVALSKKIFDINLINTSIENFLKTNNSLFDIVHLHHVMEHLQNPLKILDGIRKLLKKNGIIMIEVPNQLFKLNKKNLQICFGLKKQRLPYNPYHHIYFFSPLTIKKIFMQTGYRIMEINEPTRKGLDKILINFINSLLGLGISNVIEVIASKK